eukprot:TRINITY_DN15993_c0_g1_i7.p1 TRINITY_DN15993_c0_g1~~TRINITY_DN15993_c0_g1_i7.p1  ORF type:complete len:307 (-),score=29.87 TRINITY_DN15993_c0_g1_i7:19-939(-)
MDLSASLSEQLAQCVANTDAVLSSLESDLHHVLAGVLFVQQPNNLLEASTLCQGFFQDCSQSTAMSAMFTRDIAQTQKSRPSRTSSYDFDFDADEEEHEEESKDASVTKLQIPILCVAVPALPRYAQAELQVFAYQSKLKPAFPLVVLPRQVHQLQSSSNLEISVSGSLVWQSLCYVQLTLAQLDSSASVLSCLPDALDASLTQLNHTRRSSDLGWSSLLFLRMYFCPRLVDANGLLSEFSAAFERVHASWKDRPALPAVSLIPVNDVLHTNPEHSENGLLGVQAYFLDLEKHQTELWLHSIYCPM